MASVFSRIFYRCVDWNFNEANAAVYDASRIFYRCVDWNNNGRAYPNPIKCRIFYRCVDWNRNGFSIRSTLKVASFTDAWIETILHNPPATLPASHLLQMRGLKQIVRSRCHSLYGRIFYRCVDWNSTGCQCMICSRSRIFYRCVDWNYA